MEVFSLAPNTADKQRSEENGGRKPVANYQMAPSLWCIMDQSSDGEKPAQASLAVHPHSCSGAKVNVIMHADFRSQAHLDDPTYCVYDTNTRLILAKHDVSRPRRCRSVALRYSQHGDA
ncbi:Piso0_004039 [Millerozyma farinosa CBS 7064]|uniref:Piso0_004039 protein n=1 Tax=Pichia sorbitophila (strain ATCC MYA-4447 / BCRC 22081 / CBS 7064 / NBRC 10061 / NRRL Y-12695) TaxID=559304 RepID=G8Y7B4_PICSO|nr:Piso0_004039 [Millerozyma farinosa CBS 7064]CCE84494.1 Piso0_004039 [Millerozyma farinosa CBS 7064]